MTQTCNDAGLSIIKKWEGLRLEAYKCPAGYWTVGYGHTGPEVVEGYAITAEQANDLLAQDIAWAEQTIRNLVTVPLTDNQFSALVSFVFNEGSGTFMRSSILLYINYNQPHSAIMYWAMYDKAHVNGHLTELPGLVARRRDEISLFQTV